MNNIEIILKTLMKMYNLTQNDLSVKTNIPLPTIRKYLKSAFNPTSKNIKKIESSFNIDISNAMAINLKDISKIKKLIDILTMLSNEFDVLINDMKNNKNEYSKKIDKYSQYTSIDALLNENEISKIKVDNTLNFFNELEKNLVIESNKINNKYNLDEDIINILRKNNIFITPRDMFVSEGVNIKIPGKSSHDIKMSKLLNIIEKLKSNLINDFKNFLEFSDPNIETISIEDLKKELSNKTKK